MSDIDCEVEPDGEKKKRKRNNQSSISDLDSSGFQEAESSKSQKKSSKKKGKKKPKTTEDFVPYTEILPEEENEQQAVIMNNIQKELKSINERLSKVLTKDDPHLENLMKATFNKMKDDFLKSISHRIDVLEHRLFEKEKENDKLIETIKSLERKVDDKEEENRTLRKEMEKIELRTQEKLNEQEQYSRRNNIRIDGIQEKGTESSNETTNRVIEVINTHMKDIKLQKSDIDIAHRLGKKKDGKRQIIVKFKSRLHTESIMRSKRLLKGTGIFINEDLTGINQLVLACARKKQPDEIDKAWTRDGRIIYKNKTGNIHTIKYEDYQTWIDLPWPSTTPTR